MLERVQVIEIGQVLSAPYAATIFADLGADVIKVEKPELGDDARHMGAAFAQGDSLHFLDMNRNKASVTIDLKSAEGVEQLHELLETADILIHNMRPGVVDTLGIDGTSLCARHPRLIYCEISGFGHGGPMKKLPAFEPVAQAFSGILSINGNPDGRSARCRHCTSARSPARAASSTPRCWRLRWPGPARTSQASSTRAACRSGSAPRMRISCPIRRSMPATARC
jgi:crotonobetainyl-CoA:carnitine CoA-transferase CaiB-like acyl-CoA transferase